MLGSAGRIRGFFVLGSCSCTPEGPQDRLSGTSRSPVGVLPINPFQPYRNRSPARERNKAQLLTHGTQMQGRKHHFCVTVSKRDPIAVSNVGPWAQRLRLTAPRSVAPKQTL